MNRRQFISYSKVGLAVAGGMYIFNPLLQLGTVPKENLRNNMEKLNDGSAKLIYFASLAPSGHNTQPWTVKIINANHWIIGLDTTRCLTVVDSENREALLSIGAFLENLVIAANVEGYDVEIEVLAKQVKDKDILDIKLHKVNYARTFDVKEIELRRTVRNNFLKENLSDNDYSILIGENKDQFRYYARASKEGNYLAERTLAANKLQTDRNSAQEELAKWIRWSNHDISLHRNGLTPETLEIEGIAKWYVKKFYSSQSVLEKSFRVATIKKIQEQVSAGSGWLLITSKDSSIPEIIDAGRKLQQLWLKVRDRKIAIHPMNQMLEEETVRNEIGPILGIHEPIQILLRVGYISDYPEPVSPRMLLTKIVL